MYLLHLLIYLLKFSSKEKRIKLEDPNGDIVCLGVEKHDSVKDVADKEAKQRVLKTLVKSGEMMRSQEPLDEKSYLTMLEDVDQLSRLVRDREFMRIVTQNVSYGKLVSYKVKGFFSMLAAAIIDES